MKIWMRRYLVILLGWVGATVLYAEDSTNKVSSGLTTNYVAFVTDTNSVSSAADSNAVTSIQGSGETNLVKSVQADEDAGWEGAFTEDHRIPFYINFYSSNGFYYEIMKASTRKGQFVTTIFSDKRRITGRVSVKLHEDLAYYDQDNDLPKPDEGFVMRRFRLSTFGRTYLLSPVTYGLEFGGADGQFEFYDGYIWLHQVPYVSSVKFGVFKAPMSLESLQSSSSLPLMERAASVNAFAHAERAGVQIGGAFPSKKGTLFGGIFGDNFNSESGDESDSYGRFIARGTWLLADSTHSGREYSIHLGASASYLYADAGGTRFRARPESYLADYMVDTGSLGGDKAFIYGLEMIWQKGPSSVHGEFFQTYADDTTGEDHRFYGGYITASHFLTGETRPYNRETGTFSRLVPRHNFSFKNRHIGALEWATRVSYIDLSHGSIQGGEMGIISTGLNCYLTKNNRIMLNVGRADVRDTSAEGDLYFIQSRFQVEF